MLAARCLCCNLVHDDTRHARLCPRGGAQMAQHQPLMHTMPRVFKRISIAYIVDDGSPFLANHDLRMYISALSSSSVCCPLLFLLKVKTFVMIRSNDFYDIFCVLPHKHLPYPKQMLYIYLVQYRSLPVEMVPNQVMGEMVLDGDGQFIPAGIDGFHTLSLLLASRVAHNRATEDNHTHAGKERHNII